MRIQSLILTALVAAGVVGPGWADGPESTAPEVLKNAYLWLDATRKAGDQMTVSDGSVTLWKSAVGGTSAKTYTLNANTPSAPTLVTVGEKALVSFGSTTDSRDLRFGAGDTGTDGSTAIRAVYFVGKIEQGPNAFLLGHRTAYHFHRGTGGEYWENNHASENIRNGETRWNGVKVESPTTTVVPSGFGLISVYTTGGVSADQICYDRNGSDPRRGGKDVAELIILNAEVPEENRASVENYLMDKWIYAPEVTAASATWSSKTGLTPSSGWTNGKAVLIKNTQQADATLNFDETFATISFGVSSTADKSLTLTKSTDATLTSQYGYDFSAAEGRVKVDFDTGASPVIAGKDTVLTRLGTGTITVERGMKVTLEGAARGWTESLITIKDGGTLVVGGTDAFGSVPFSTGANNIGGTVIYAGKVESTDDAGMQFNGNLVRDFEEGADITVRRFVTGNQNNANQTFRQAGGSITATGTGGVQPANDTGYSTASILFAHWPSTVTYNLTGGSLTATAGANGSIYLCRDGDVTLNVGGGASAATLKTNGLVDDARMARPHANTRIDLKPNGVFEVGQYGVTLVSSAQFTMSGGTLRAYEDATVSVAQANGVQLAEGSSSTLAAEAGKTLTVSAPLTGAGSLAIGANGAAGTVKLTSAASTATGTFTVSGGSTLVVLATAEGTATPYTIAGGGAVKLVLSEAQQARAIVAEITLGNTFATDFSGTLGCLDTAGKPLEKLTVTCKDGVVKVAPPSSRKTLTWNGTTWVDESGTVTAPDGDSVLSLKAGDDIELTAALAPFAVTLPETGQVTLKGYKHLSAHMPIVIPSGATLRLDYPGNNALGDNAIASTQVFMGAGTVELYLSHENPWLNGFPVADANFANDFTGRLRIGRGQFKTGAVIKQSVTLEVVDGGTLHLAGGEWNNRFVLSGEGWNPTQAVWDAVPLRLDNTTIGPSATLEFRTEGGKKAGLGNTSLTVNTIRGTLVGADGFRVTSGYFKLAESIGKTTDLKGTVDLMGGVIEFGAGNYSTASFRFCDEVKIGADATLKWHTRTTSDVTSGETDKGKIDTAFTLNGGTLELVDGSYVFNKDVTVAADSTLALHWAKGRIFKSLKGGKGVTLTLTSDNRDQTKGWCYFTGGDFAGTLKCVNSGAIADTWLSPVGTTFANATLDVGESSKFYLALSADATLGALKGSTDTSGDGVAARTLTLKGGAYAGTFKDLANGATSAENPLSLVVAGDTALSGALNHSGTTTVLSGTLTLTGAAATSAATKAITLAGEGNILLDAQPTSTENYTVEPADEAAKAAGQGSVIKLVSVSKGDKWTVAVGIDEDKMPGGKKIDDTLYAFGAEGLDALAGATEATPVTLAAGKVTPGLYYSIRYASDVRFTEGVGETDRVLATAGAPVALSVPAAADVSVRFFKVAASLTAQ